MTAGLIWANLLAYALQVGVVVGLGAAVPSVLRLRAPRVRLFYWQMLLGACLLLPWIRGWRQEVVTGTGQVSSLVTVAGSAGPVGHSALPLTRIALWMLAAGVAWRLGRMVLGMARLAMYRRRGFDLPHGMRMPGIPTNAALRVSGDVAGPVTFGWREPVILLPAGFPQLEPAMREAILCHELVHVARRDWLFAIGEELVRAVLWFHPAIWWVISEIQLAREQSVDEAVIGMTQARGPYVDALLAMAMAGAGAAGRMDLAPAAMFLRRRHLKRRVMDVMKEARMTTISKTRLVFGMSAAMVVVAGVCWLASGAFPLSAAPQVVEDSAGVAVNLNGSALMHRSGVSYPAEALAKGVEGTVVVQVKLDKNGEVSDAAVLSGPDELRRGVLQSVLNWHFDKSLGLSTRAVNVDFVKPAVSAAVFMPRAAGGRGGSGGGMAGAIAQRPAPVTAKVARITVNGLSDSAREQLLAALPVHVGDEFSSARMSQLTQAARAFDSHLTSTSSRTGPDGFDLTLGFGSAALVAAYRPAAVPMSPIPVPAPADQAGVFRVGNGTTAPSVVSKVDPDYTEEARAAKYSGSVMLSVVINPEGQAEDISVVKSLGMGLDEKAIEALQQWKFRPGTNNGVPVKVRAQIEVNFRLL